MARFGHRAAGRARSASFWVAETETQMLFELVGWGENHRTPSPITPISPDLGEATVPVEPLYFACVRSACLPRWSRVACCTSVKPDRPAPKTRLSRVMSKRSPPTLMEPLIAPNRLQRWLHSRTREYSVTRSSPIKRRRGWLEPAKLARRHSSVPFEADKGISPGLVQR